MIDLLLLRIAAGLGINALFALGAYRAGAVTPGGAAAGILVGTILFASGGLVFWLLMGAFFLSSTLLSRYKRERKEKASLLQEKHDVRDAVQVLANGGPGALWALLYLFFPGPEAMMGVVASYAAANADTWAGEVGVLSSQSPRLITGGGPVQPGRSGGVTPVGIAASLGGALFIAGLFLACARALPVFSPDITPGERILFGLCAAGGGFLGALIDSLLGATVQARFTDPRTGTFTERSVSEHGPNRLAHGFRAITNDAVNLLSFLGAGTAAAACGLLFL
jgi:uncharacterized protein (TIGR00297 family)